MSITKLSQENSEEIKTGENMKTKVVYGLALIVFAGICPITPSAAAQSSAEGAPPSLDASMETPSSSIQCHRSRGSGSYLIQTPSSNRKWYPELLPVW